MGPWLVRLGLAWLLLALLPAAAVEAGVVLLEVRSVDGGLRGRLPALAERGVTYVSLTRLAALVGGKVSGDPRSRHATLTVAGRRARVSRESPEVWVQGRTLRLTAAPRLRRGEWEVPGEFLVRVLPGLLGRGLHVTVASAPPGPPLKVKPVVAVKPARPARPAPKVAAIERPEVAPPPSPAPAPGTRLLDLRSRSYPTYTRVVLEGGAPFEPLLVDGAGGLLVRLPGLAVSPDPAPRPIGDGLVATLQLVEERGMPGLRITFEGVPGPRKVFRLEDPYRLVVDLYRPPTPRPPSSSPSVAPLRHIVLDPGHGGHDPGAIGPGGLQEKELVLDVARRLARLLEEGLGVKITLTRARDEFIPLRERTAQANRLRADLFVSIHANAARVGAASGAETYFLSSEATDKEARAVAAYENKVIDLEPTGSAAQRDLLKTILWDLAQSEFQEESSRLAESLQDSLEQALRLPNRGVKQAPFYVLGGATMPAVLVEIGFLSHPREEQKLRDEGYRERIAQALYAGLAAHKRRYDRKLGIVTAR